MAKKKPQTRTAPQVGIIFFFGNRLWIETTPLECAGTYGEFKIHEGDHIVYWDQLIRRRRRSSRLGVRGRSTRARCFQHLHEPIPIDVGSLYFATEESRRQNRAAGGPSGRRNRHRH
jgi:hypothetical protein